MSDLTPGHESGAHALNNVLCKILGMAELALDRAEDPAMRADLAAIMDLAELAAPMIRAWEKAP
jgi:hypothetical protein